MLVRGLVAIAVVLAASAARLEAQGSPNEAPPPDSAAQVVSSIEGALVHDTAQTLLNAAQRRGQSDLSIWLRESRLTMQLRGYGFLQEKLDGSQPEALAAGGWMRFRTGRWNERFTARAALYMSLRTIGDTAHGGTGILAPDQGNLVSLAVLNAEAYWGRQVFTAGRQDLTLPLVNKADTRMIPQTFEAVMGRGPLVKYVDWVGGWLFRYKPRDQDRFRPMSQANSGVTASRGMAALGLRRVEGHRLAFGVFDNYVPDVHNILWSEVSWYGGPVAGIKLRLGAQLGDQRSVGAALLPGSPYDTRFVAGRLGVNGPRGGLLQVALSHTTDGGEFASPYGLFPGHTSTMTTDFTRAGETAWHVDVSRDFGGAGLYGFTAFAGLSRGTGAHDAAGAPLTNRTEFELTLDYKPERGTMRDVWFRARFAKTWQDTGPDAWEFRLIGYYDVPLPWPPPPGTRPAR